MEACCLSRNVETLYACTCDIYIYTYIYMGPQSPTHDEKLNHLHLVAKGNPNKNAAMVPLKEIEYGIYGVLTITYPKPYSIYLREPIILASRIDMVLRTPC